MIKRTCSLEEPLPLLVTDKTVYKRTNIVTTEDTEKGFTCYEYDEEILTIVEYIDSLMNSEDYAAITEIILNLSNKVDDLEARIIALENV